MTEVVDQINLLKTRFEQHMARHPKLVWSKIESKLLASPKKLSTLIQMEQTGGEPDVISYDNQSSSYLFADCSIESPKSRRNLCYDQKALDERKQFKPKNSAMSLAESMGAQLMTEAEYRHLQTLGSFDLKTSSWLATPAAIRKLGGAIFGDRRYNQVFIYHNGASSYYAVRGFRATIHI